MFSKELIKAVAYPFLLADLETMINDIKLHSKNLYQIVKTLELRLPL